MEKNHSSGELNSTDLPTGSKVGKEATYLLILMSFSAPPLKIYNCSGVSVLNGLDLSEAMTKCYL